MSQTAARRVQRGAARSSSRRGRHTRSETEAPLSSAPSRYISRVSAASGEELPGEIDPSELLVHAHRDNHPVEVATQFLASRVVQLTGNEQFVRRGLRAINAAGALVADGVGAVSGSGQASKRTRQLIGVAERVHFFKFREPTPLSEKEVKARIAALQADARVALRKRGRSPRLNVLLTGATGFLGKEILCQAANDRRIEQLVAVVRPESVRDPKTKQVVKVLSPRERGEALLRRLHIPKPQQKKFRFIEGDIEKPQLGIAAGELARLRRSLTHVIHCAASVAFDDPYESSFRANVLGCVNALRFSDEVQRAPGSSFVQHVAIETSYIHGRKKSSFATEEALAFPRHFYNNYYELTKAMASIETDRFLVEKGLRVAQLLPSIVIGHSRTGNNRGDTKVVNAPINAFGRAKEAAEAARGSVQAQAKTWLLGLVANAFPGDATAQLNLVPVDRVVQGILASLTVPEAIGARIHLATDNRIRAQTMVRVCKEELGVNVRLADPTVYRNLTLPLVKAILEQLNEPRLANVLEKLGNIFGGYSEWGQPIHRVGNDVRLLGLPIRRPHTVHAFRMLCRHNKYVQEFGRVRDADEIARRERLWEIAIEELEQETGHEAGSIPGDEFRRLLGRRLDLRSFTPKR